MEIMVVMYKKSPLEGFFSFYKFLNITTMRLPKIYSILFLLVFSNSSWGQQKKQKELPSKAKFKLEYVIIKSDKEPLLLQDTTKMCLFESDSIRVNAKYRLKLYKKHAHASYYASKFNGKRTSSGIRFSNNKYTAAHRKLPFGTKLKITNEANKRSVIVEVIDRGPFSRGREIDITSRAFKEITDGGSGSTLVTIEEILK